MAIWYSIPPLQSGTIAVAFILWSGIEEKKLFICKNIVFSPIILWIVTHDFGAMWQYCTGSPLQICLSIILSQFACNFLSITIWLITSFVYCNQIDSETKAWSISMWFNILHISTSISKRRNINFHSFFKKKSKCKCTASASKGKTQHDGLPINYGDYV